MQFREELRYEYPLTESSLVIDLGAYKGTFAAEISRRYNCRVRAYEPIYRFYTAAKEVLRPYPKARLFNNGVASVGANAIFGIKGDMTGSFTASDETENVSLLAIDDVLDEPCDLLKINIEGGEYDLLDYMLHVGLVMDCKNIQVQFHGNIPGCKERWQSNRDGLLKTHKLTYDFPFCWENYERLC